MTFLDTNALTISPLLSSRAVLTVLCERYKNTIKSFLTKQNIINDTLTENEMLALLKNPVTRLLIDSNVSFKLHSFNSFHFQKTFKSSSTSFDDSEEKMYDLISPAPFTTSLITPYRTEENTIADSVIDLFYQHPGLNLLRKEWGLAQPSEEELSTLSKTLIKLGQLTSEPIEDLAFNVRYIVLLKSINANNSNNKSISFSMPSLPGIIFLGGSILSQPIELMESIYHETLHNKLINTYTAFRLLDYKNLKSVLPFKCPWCVNNTEKEWPYMRAFAAYHVYCHLSSFHKLIIKHENELGYLSEKRLNEIIPKLQLLNEYIQSVSVNTMTVLGKKFIDFLKIG